MSEPRGLRVLLVEDDPGERWIVSEILRSRGHVVTTCGRAETAWERYQENPFPLVLLDWMLPTMDGLELCRRIRRSPAGDTTVLVVVTSRDEPEDLEEVLRAGADDYVTKPLDVGLMNIRLAVAEQEVREVRRRRKTQRQLEAAHGELQRLFEKLDEVFFTVDVSEETLLQVSPGARRILGRSPEELKADPALWRELLYPRELQSQQVELASEGEHTVTHQYSIRTPSGEVRWLEASVKATADGDGELMRVDGIVSDVTERREAQRALAAREREHRALAARLQRANEELEAFAYSVSHDLRTPLRTMQGFAHALLQDYGDRMPEEAQDFVGRILASGERAEELIRDLLAYSRLSFEELRLRPVALEGVVSEALERVGEEVDAVGAEIEVEGSLPEVLGHASTLVQVLVNLLSNALKFVPAGRAPRIRVRGERRGDVVRLWVEDNGEGIPRDQHERIFRVFERRPEDADRPGTGIGLAIVRRGMERVGGSSGVESAPGEGSRFWVELPPAGAQTGDRRGPRPGA